MLGYIIYFPADTPNWKKSAGGAVYVTPSTDYGDGNRQLSYLEELGRLAAESKLAEEDSSSSLDSEPVFSSVEEVSSDFSNSFTNRIRSLECSSCVFSLQ